MSQNPPTRGVALPAGARKVIYVVLLIVAAVFSAFQAAQGDWVVFVGGVLTALTGLLAASNTPPTRRG